MSDVENTRALHMKQKKAPLPGIGTPSIIPNPLDT
ncbi:hypothetical protein PSFL111601_13140 [Pseudomonas floridensis]